MIRWDYSNRKLLELELLEAADKEKYEEAITKRQSELLEMFFELNEEKSSKQNIRSFFTLLSELITYANISEVKNGRVQD